MRDVGILLFVAAVLSLVAGCGGGGGAALSGAGPIGGGSSGFTVSGSIDLPDNYPIVHDTESTDSSATAPFKLTPVSTTRPGVATGTIGGAGDQIDTSSMQVTAGTHAVRLSYMDFGQASAHDLDADIYFSDGINVTFLAALNLQTNPETTSVTVPGTGFLLVDIGLVVGGKTSWRLDIRSGSGIPLTAGRGTKSVAGEAEATPIVRRAYTSTEARQDTLLVHFTGPVATGERDTLLARHGLAAEKTLSSGTVVARRTTNDPATGADHYWHLLDLARAVATEPTVRFAEPDAILHHLGTTPNDPYAFQQGAAISQQWHYDMIRVRSAWDLTMGSPGIIVAVVDTGVVLAHPDLQANLVAGYDFISDTSNSNDGDGMDANPDDPGDGGGWGLDSWHGTHVSGTIAAAANNGIGGTGVAPRCSIMPVRVLGVFGGYISDVAEGIRFASGLPNLSGTVPPVPARIINMSLGGPGPESNEEILVMSDSTAAGVILIAAAGNSGGTSSNPISYPAGDTNVISVAAVNRFGARAFYSTYNSDVEIAAPGGDMTSASKDGVASTYADRVGTAIQPSYWYEMGTSMASPHVAGVVALMLSAKPTLTLAEVRSVLSQTAQDAGAAGRDDEYGYGIIDAYEAVSNVSSATVPDAPSAVPIDDALTLFSDQISASLLIKNAGTGVLSLSLASVQQYGAEHWAVASVAQVAGGFTVTVTPNRSTTPSGNLYIANVVLNTNDLAQPQLLVPVYLLQLDREPFTKQVQVELLDGNHHTVRKVAATTDSLGRLATFSITGVTAGPYWLIAYHDANANTQLETGEFYGAWPNRDQPQILVVGTSNPTTGLFLRVLEIGEPIS